MPLLSYLFSLALTVAKPSHSCSNYTPVAVADLEILAATPTFGSVNGFMTHVIIVVAS